MLLKISQNSQENTCARASFLTKLQASVNFEKFLRTLSLIEHLLWLLLYFEELSKLTAISCFKDVWLFLRLTNWILFQPLKSGPNPPKEFVSMKALESDEKCFLFHLKALFVLKVFRFLSWLFDHVEKTGWFERLG